MRLNIGCGNRRLLGYVGVDAVKRDAVDIIAPAHAIPLEDGCAEEISAIHVVEHMYAWDVPDALAEWFRLLNAGGRLNLEMPDIVKSCRNIADGFTKAGKHVDQMGLWGCFGDPRLKDPYMCHRYGWTFKTIAPLVEAAGFVDIVEAKTQFHPCGRDMRDFRLEANKP